MDRVRISLAIVAVFNFYLILSVSAYYDYCSLQRAKCGGKPHIGCKSSKTFTVSDLTIKISDLKN